MKKFSIEEIKDAKYYIIMKKVIILWENLRNEKVINEIISFWFDETLQKRCIANHLSIL